MIRFYLLLLGFLIACNVKAQTSLSDSSFLSSAKKNSISLYNSKIKEGSRLYNGKSYIEYQRQEDEHPYFIDDWVDGSIVYDGEWYEEVPLLYDLSKDMLITDHPYSANKIQLTTEKIDQFTLNNHLFVQLRNEKIANGFYELPHNAQTKVYVVRKKSSQTRAARNSIERYFIEKVSIYIKKDGNYHVVKSKRSMLKVFADQKQDLKKFIRENHLKFNADKVQSISKVAAFYDQLTHHEG